ncbi:VacJ lipoprotein [Salmonella enterica subsp. enterica]|uniref:VacJ lipoprotein n=1 Tax=Salmonella enterica I TaxID=59201 RepID=A0A3S4K8K3_SALET|nr:VacJ lipoprotein [Salmonella enterica subsp. enterica]
MADTLYPVLSWLTWPMSIGKWTIEGIETRAQLLDSDGLLRQSSDPYIMVREAYFQRHDFIANGGKLKPQEKPERAGDSGRTQRDRLGINGSK